MVNTQSASERQEVHLRYMPQLDGLRAIAVALVLVHHAVYPFAFGGQIGVDIFFVLSGYLITSILHREIEARGRIRLRSFYGRRLARLYPSLLTALAVFTVPAILLAPSAVEIVKETVAAATYTMPYYISLGGDAVVWRHTWSLGIEELFYLAWPIALVYFVRHHRRRMAIGFTVVGLLMLSCLPFVGMNVGMFFRMGAMLLGAALAIRLSSTPSRSLPAGASVAGVLLLVGACLLGGTHGLENTASSLAAVGTVLLLGHLARPSRPTVIVKLLALKPLVYVGKISYELYLFHFPALVIFAWLLGTDQMGAALIALPVAIILAVLTHAFIGPVSEKLKRKLPY